MKRIIKFSILILISIVFIYGILKDINRVRDIHFGKNRERFVSYNGWLKVDGNNIVNSKGDIFQLRGVSTFYIGEYYHLYTKESLTALKEELGVNVIRVAMATDPKIGGYIAYNEIKNDLMNVVDIAIKLDMYVIIDWHILNDNDPLIYIEEADIFFNEVSKKYKNNPNVIYEICNEPNGDITWDKNVVPYANRIINTIRSNSPDSIIIVGTPDWCKDLKSVIKNPLEFDNIVYALHFYAASHGKELMNEIDAFRKKGYAVFVSECGMSESSGTGNISLDNFKTWIKFLDKRNISWVYWKFSNKKESSDMLVGNYMRNKNVEYKLDDYLSETGKEIKNIFLSY